MSNTEEVVADLGATVDYIKGEVTEQADTFSFEDILIYEEAVRLVQKAASEALAMLNTEKLNQLEKSGSRQIGSKVYARVPKHVDRFDHEAIAKAVRQIAKDEAVNRSTGEVDLGLAVEKAVKIMDDLYVAPSSKAKIGTLDALAIPVREVRTREKKGHEIRVIDLEEKADAEEE